MIYTSELFRSNYNSRYPATSTCRLAAINSGNSRQPLSNIHQASANCLTSSLSSSSYSLYSMTRSHYNSIKCSKCNLATFDSQYNGNYYTQRRTTAHTMSSSSSSPGLFLISSTTRSIKEMVSVCFTLT